MFIRRQSLVAVAAAAVMVVVMMVTVAAFVTAAALTAAATAVTVAVHTVDDGLYLVARSLASLYYGAREVKVETGKTRVEIHLNMGVGYLQHVSVEEVAVGILQRHYGVDKDIVVVEMAVDGEDATIEVYYTLRDIFSVSLGGRQREVEGVTGVKTPDLGLETVEGQSKTCIEMKRLVSGSLFYHVRLAVLCNVELVGHGYIPVC